MLVSGENLPQLGVNSGSNGCLKRPIKLVESFQSVHPIIEATG
jgi:hypothetical protein